MTEDRATNSATAEANAWIVAIAEDRDRDAFAALFTRFAPRVKSYLVRQGAPDRAAEELAQDILLAVWRNAKQFDPSRTNASAWIYSITRNRWVDHLRRRRRAGERPVDAEWPQLSPEEQLKTAEGEARLREAIGKLPSEQAAMLQMALFEDVNHAEMARRLGVPLGKVRSRLRLARALLRAALASNH